MIMTPLRSASGTALDSARVSIFPRMESDAGRTVAGEPIQLLARALRRFEVRRRRAGSAFLDVKLPPDLSLPLLRALMRIEAELLTDEANRLSATYPDPRTDEQRRADALMALALRVEEALDS